MKYESCGHCPYDVPVSWQHCPHCGRPRRFPNVLAALDPEEQTNLDNRYKTAVNSATKVGCLSLVQEFEAATSRSQAVIARPIGEVLRLATTDRELYSTFYQLRDLRLPKGMASRASPNWDAIRAVADTALFGDDNKKEIRFASLTLEDVGLNNYGECSMILREDMISHRTSIFEENSLIFMRRHKVSIWESPDLPKGYRCTWADRGKLCVAKLSAKITTTTKKEDFQSVLTIQGQSSLEDDFVEAHIFGTLTVRSLRKVVVTRKSRQPSRGKLKALEELLTKAKVEMEVRP
jgi:hypothetical protein